MGEQIKKSIKNFGLPRIIILAFFLLLIAVAAAYDMKIPALMGDVVRRWGMYGVLVLAMVPGIQCGIGPNFGVTIGIAGGLMGALIAVEMRFKGFFDAMAGNVLLAFHDKEGEVVRAITQDMVVEVLLALVFALIISTVLGMLYGILLNRVKGSEMTVSTYVGFSFVALMNIMWLMLPFRSPTSIWPLGGEGLRNTINLEQDFAYVFNNLGFNIGTFYLPVGLLLFFFLCCFVVWMFTRSRTGAMMSAAGANPNFARAAGINVDRMRILGTTVSTVLGAVGIVAYAQSYGFLQLYNAPQFMGFACVASVLIGGASVNRARIFNVLLGAFLFHGILAVALPVANNILPEGNLSEILRIIISNGIILYALSKAKEGR